MTEPAGRITLLTDFGTADGYPAAVRGVLASRAPGILVEDVSHTIRPGDVVAAAAALRRYWAEYPVGTVHVAVVDPGVGGPRRGLLVTAAGRFGVGPDNGVLTPLLEAPDLEDVREIRNPALFRHPVSATFHGRDVFAPVAAYLAQGGLAREVGPLAGDPIRLGRPGTERTPSGRRGVVTGRDRFGNLATSVPAAEVTGAAAVIVGGTAVGPIRRTYAEVESGGLLALIGSDGYLEIAVRDGNAAVRLAARPGTWVEVVLPATDD